MKTAFITGASSGIGRAAVKLFLDNNWQVIAAMRKPENEHELKTCNHVYLVQCDVTNSESVQSAMAQAIEKVGQIDVLVNNAGVYNSEPLETINDRTIDQVIDTNIKGVIHCIQAVLPYFVHQGSGTIINISSVAGFASFPYQTIYQASKWGVEGLSESLQYELKSNNIRIKIVEPGMVKNTNLYDQLHQSNQNEIPQAYKESFASWYQFLIQHKDNGAQPEHIARTIYKAATDSSWRMRYKSGKDTKLVALLQSLLPFTIFRWILEKVVGLR